MWPGCVGVLGPRGCESPPTLTHCVQSAHTCTYRQAFRRPSTRTAFPDRQPCIVMHLVIRTSSGNASHTSCLTSSRQGHCFEQEGWTKPIATARPATSSCAQPCSIRALLAPAGPAPAWGSRAATGRNPGSSCYCTGDERSLAAPLGETLHAPSAVSGRGTRAPTHERRLPACHAPQSPYCSFFL